MTTSSTMLKAIGVLKKANINASFEYPGFISVLHTDGISYAFGDITGNEYDYSREDGEEISYECNVEPLSISATPQELAKWIIEVLSHFKKI